MRLLLIRDHRVDVPNRPGAGKMITNLPSGSSSFQHDLLAKGLSELGHEVICFVPEGLNMIPIPEVKSVNNLITDIDLVHLKAPGNREIIAYYEEKNIPVLETSHGFRPEIVPPCKRVYVSKTQAEMHNSDDYIWNGLDPADFIYTSEKRNYFLFIATIQNLKGKGLDIALRLSKELGFKLIVAGSSKLQKDIDAVQALCSLHEASYVGDVRGKEKAELITGAKALLSPSRLPETFGITLAEALFSGTPVICSDNGAYGEIMSPEVSFVCRDESDYRIAFRDIEKIDTETCRAYALKHFHYLNTAEKYVEIYTEMMSSTTRKLMYEIAE